MIWFIFNKSPAEYHGNRLAKTTSEKDKLDTLFSGFEFMRRRAFDNCHGSYPVSFLYFLYKLDRILSVKTLGKPVNLACQSRYSGLILYRTWTC